MKYTQSLLDNFGQEVESGRWQQAYDQMIIIINSKLTFLNTEQLVIFLGKIHLVMRNYLKESDKEIKSIYATIDKSLDELKASIALKRDFYLGASEALRERQIILQDTKENSQQNALTYYRLAQSLMDKTEEQKNAENLDLLEKAGIQQIFSGIYRLEQDQLFKDLEHYLERASLSSSYSESFQLLKTYSDWLRRFTALLKQSSIHKLKEKQALLKKTIDYFSQKDYQDLVLEKVIDFSDRENRLKEVVLIIIQHNTFFQNWGFAAIAYKQLEFVDKLFDEKKKLKKRQLNAVDNRIENLKKELKDSSNDSEIAKESEARAKHLQKCQEFEEYQQLLDDPLDQAFRLSREEEKKPIQPAVFLEPPKTDLCRNGYYNQKIKSWMGHIASDLHTNKPIAAIQVENTKTVQIFFQEVIHDCESLLGPAPCGFAFIGLGSYAREEMSPCSDIDFAVLVVDEDKRKHFYFKSLILLVRFKMEFLPDKILMLENGDISSLMSGGMIHSPQYMVADNLALPPEYKLYLKSEIKPDKGEINIKSEGASLICCLLSPSGEEKKYEIAKNELKPAISGQFEAEKLKSYTPQIMKTLLERRAILDKGANWTATESYSLRRARLLAYSRTDAEKSKTLFADYQQRLQDQYQKSFLYLKTGIAQPLSRHVGVACLEHDFKVGFSETISIDAKTRSIQEEKVAIKSTLLKPINLWLLHLGNYYRFE